MRIGGVSYWWESLGGPPPRRPALDGSLDVDVCIVGAGFTGLWTALFLRRADPSLRIAVLEREFAGFGASGRNGGWVSALSPDPALRPALVDTIGLVAAEGIDCDFLHAGSVTVACNRPALERLRAEHAAEQALGGAELLGPGELPVAVRGALGGLYTPHCARVHPAKLVRGLASRVEEAGVRIFEDTAASSVEPRRVRGAFGQVRAEWVVRATEGYTPGLAGARRALVPLNSAMIATEPVDVEWREGVTLLDGAHAYCYAQRTADGRIAIGGRGRPYRFASRTDRGGEVALETAAALQARASELFGPVEAAHAWAGVLGVPRDWLPSVGAADGFAWAGGYAGDGVSTAHLAGRTLRDLILRRASELTRLPWVGHDAPRWEPEPLRWAAIHGVYAAYRRADATEQRTNEPSRLAAFADRVAGR